MVWERLQPLMGLPRSLIIWYAPFFIYGLLAFTSALLVWLVCRSPRKGGKGTIEGLLGPPGQIFSQKGRGLIICFLAGC